MASRISAPVFLSDSPPRPRFRAHRQWTAAFTILYTRLRYLQPENKAMDAFTTITVEARDSTEILSLNRPDALNSVTPEMIDELTAYFSGLHDRLATRIVILRGNGRAFCAGAELGSDAFSAPGSGRAQRQLKMQQRYSQLIRLMRG